MLPLSYSSHKPFFLFPYLLHRSTFPKFLTHHLCLYNPSIMSPPKGECLSHHKGKEVAANDPSVDATKGEEAPHSNSDHSKEEEVSRYWASALLSLTHGMTLTIIFWWYLVITFLLHWVVWLALERCDTEVYWTPLTSTIPNLAICQGDILPMPIHFEVGFGTSSNWKTWVNKELFDVGFMEALQQASVLKAIVSHYNKMYF